MASRIEEIIEEIEDYIDSCKPSAFSSSKIVVNRDELEGLLEELRTKTPDEIKRYQKIISNKEAILADAQSKADAIIAQAQIQTNELVSEHQIMQQAYAQANEVVMIATKNAQEMLDKAFELALDRLVSLPDDEYVALLADCVRHTPPQMVIHRLTGDGYKKHLAAPLWSGDKKRTLNAINQYFRTHDIVQGQMSPDSPK